VTAPIAADREFEGKTASVGDDCTSPMYFSEGRSTQRPVAARAMNAAESGSAQAQVKSMRPPQNEVGKIEGGCQSLLLLLGLRLNPILPQSSQNVITARRDRALRSDSINRCCYRAR